MLHPIARPIVRPTFPDSSFPVSQLQPSEPQPSEPQPAVPVLGHGIDGILLFVAAQPSDLHACGNQLYRLSVPSEYGHSGEHGSVFRHIFDLVDAVVGSVDPVIPGEDVPEAQSGLLHVLIVVAAVIVPQEYFDQRLDVPVQAYEPDGVPDAVGLQNGSPPCPEDGFASVRGDIAAYHAVDAFPQIGIFIGRISEAETIRPRLLS